MPTNAEMPNASPREKGVTTVVISKEVRHSHREQDAQ